MTTMRAMVWQRAGEPLAPMTVPRPSPGPGELLIRVRACGVCRTDLHLVDGELPDPKLPLMPGHEIVGDVVAHGAGVAGPRPATASACPGSAPPAARAATALRPREPVRRRCFTGYTRDGGYAEYVAADARYVFPLPARYDDLAAAPLLCAGLIGYRAYDWRGRPRRSASTASAPRRT